MCTKETSIYYFSGTGNSLAAAKQLAAELGGNISPIAVTKELTDSAPEVACSVCVLITPAYAYGLPALVRRFLKHTNFKCGYFAALATCGTTAGGTFAATKRLLKKSGQKLSYSQIIHSVENYVHMFGFPAPAEITACVESQRTGVKIAAETIKARATNKIRSFRPFSAFINWLFRSAKWMFAGSYRVTADCVACGLCTRICPAAAITEKEDGKPRFSMRKCNHCQSCLNACPQKAIKYMKIRPDGPRYIHPDVKAEELIKR